MVKGKRIKKVLIIAAIAAAVLSAAFFIMWLVYKQIYFDRVLKSNPGFEIKEGLDCTAYSMRIYSASDSEVPAYSMMLVYPDNAGRGFTGNYSISQPLVMDEQGKSEDDFVVSLSVKPHLFTETVYSLTVSDYSNAVNCFDEDGKKSYFFTMNKDMELSYGDSAEFAELLDKAGDRINEIFAVTKEKFCID